MNATEICDVRSLDISSPQMRVVYFKSNFGDWGYRVEKGETIWLSFGFKTKRAAMRDYRRNKPLD